MPAMRTNGLAIITRMLVPYAFDTRSLVSSPLTATAVRQEGHENASSARAVSASRITSVRISGL